ncbi:MAG TPA: DUF485 domain-containing protein [Streptosporangiaceae bacterium]|jgi:uncharacterized membrane protein (DUF485 family)
MPEDRDHAQAAPVDWDAAGRLPEYRELRAMRNRVVVPITVVYLAGYFGFLIVAVTASSALGGRVHGGLNVAYLLMCGVFVLVWVVAFIYIRAANGRLDDQSAKVAAKIREAAGPGEAPR